ncbi:MAG: hypothetical protein AAF658_04590, partial [Myxococcota bacterium]
VECFERSLACDGDSPTGPMLHLEIAKLLEHKCRDYARARVHALAGAEAEDGLQSAKRLARIDRKQKNQSSRTKSSSLWIQPC